MFRNIQSTCLDLVQVPIASPFNGNQFSMRRPEEMRDFAEQTSMVTLRGQAPTDFMRRQTESPALVQPKVSVGLGVRVFRFLRSF
jgi:hypothetical protein